MTPEKAASSAPDLGTMKLDWAMVEFLDHAQRLNCHSIASRLVELTLDAKRPVLLGAIVIFLQGSDITKLCRLWASTDSTFGELADLAEGLWKSPQIPSNLNFHDRSIPVATRFRGDLSVHYLPAMLAADRPNWIKESDADWLQAMRLWILGLALEANQSRIFADQHIEKLCQEIRPCCDDRASNKFENVSKLVTFPVPATVDAFETNLRQSCQRVLSQEVHLDLNFQRLLNRHLKALFARDWLAVKHIAPLQLPVFSIAPLSASDSPRSGFPGDAGDENNAPLRGTLGTQASFDFSDADEDQNPAEQELASRGIYLLNREESQILPWSWHRLTSNDRQGFFQLIEQLGKSADPVERLAGAILVIAYLTSQSARQVADMAIGTGPSDEWYLHKKTCQLWRSSPRRDNGWTVSGSNLSSDDARRWLRPVAKDWILNLNEDVKDTLIKALRRAPTPISIGQLWQAVCPNQTFDNWANARFAMTPGLARLTSPILASVVRQDVFGFSQDHVLARLVSASGNKGLPAPCAYAGFTGGRIGEAFSTLPPAIGHFTVAAAQSDFNWAGSQLDVIESHLVKQIGSLFKRLDQAAKDPLLWVKHHNLMVTYVVTAMFATTGARPVHSPFESARWLDFDRGYVFVDDKSGGLSRGSRLCLITGPVASLLQTAYFPHLKRLAEGLRENAPDFALSIDATLKGDADTAMPLFFFIRSEPNLDWLEVSESGLTAECGRADWPLPFNFFRHRLATGLRRRGLDPEIIDALLGHAEDGAETHGPHSLRILADDLEVARPLVHAMTDELGFKIPSPIRHPMQTVVAKPAATSPSFSRRYGTKARAIARKQSHDLARASALHDIKVAMGDKNPASLTSEQWDQVALSMIVRKDGLPHAMGSLRYDLFQSYLRSLWDSHGIKPKIKRRYLLGRPIRPVVSEGVVDAPKVLQALTNAFEAIVLQHASGTVGPQFASTLAAIDASLFGGIADAKVLTTLALHANVKAVHFQSRCYVEHFIGDTWVDTMPRRRFEVSSRCLNWLLIGMSERKKLDKLPQLSEKLFPLAELTGLGRAANTGALLQKIAAIVGQVNVVSRSGLAAAVLDGRVHVSALPHQDWLRTATGKAPKTQDFDPTADDNSDLMLGMRSRKRDAKKNVLPLTPEESCRELFQKIREVMTGPGDKTGKQDAITALLVASPFDLGDLPFALGQWAAYLLKRPARTKSGLLDPNSSVRYFNALAPKVAAVASAANIGDAEEDELLEIYSNILEAKASIGSRPGSESTVEQTSEGKNIGSDVADEDTDEPSSIGTDLAAHEQLFAFHQWAQDVYGLDDPDWSELDEFTPRPVGRPGLILESEYFWSLKKLVGARASQTTPDEFIQDAFLLLLGYRFGLRGAEAFGLLRSDWVDVAATIVVLVRPNHLRGLKNLQSKRQVPLLELLSETEHSIIDEVVRRWEGRQGVERDTPLLRDLTKANFKTLRLYATGRVRKLLKQATTKSSTTFHHLRHGFAFRATAMLGGSDFGLGAVGLFNPTAIDNARRLLLGQPSPKIDRRILWAVCRLLGHSSPATLLKAYFHGLATAPLTREVDEPNTTFDKQNLIDLDGVESNIDYLAPLTEVGFSPEGVTSFSRSLESRVNYFRLRLSGYSQSRAAHAASLAIECALHLESYIADAVQRLEVSHPNDPPFLTAVDIASQIGQKRLQGLRSLANGSKGEILLEGERDLVSPEVIGRSRQLVFFRNAHLSHVAKFCSDLSLTPEDLIILRPLGRGKQLQDLLKGLELDKFIDPSCIVNGTPRQLNLVTSTRSETDNQLVTFQDRLIIMNGKKGKFHTNYELIFIWLCWTARY